MKLGAFFFLRGHHLAAWRYPAAQTAESFTFDFIKEQAQLAEQAKFNMVFFADVFGEEIAENSRSGLKFNPVVLISALQAVTKNIGFVSTLTTTYNEPFHVARKFASIDHLSGGRAAWNIVTSANPKEATLFGKEKHLEHACLYERAEEFVDVVKKLWFSVEKEALVIDKENGKFVDQLEDWFVNRAADGFNIMPPTFLEGFKDIVELVIPELQRRGLFCTEYEGTTLRENLGLKVPTAASVHGAVTQ
ncbi:LLM class flavin-dependent oxidoreductase [Kurthia massiliensis]|uniref:LLM class flavin-dependent oxidoreductase n=1 Tax=Kurthia massiliensis TaxID=1033739 RepID=UPI00031F0648|nr:LLM class flavin-dependent oxidoreductase [Kurthia massiliensis]